MKTNIEIIRNRKCAIYARRGDEIIARKVKGERWELWGSLREVTQFTSICDLHCKQVKRLMDALGGDALPMPSRFRRVRVWQNTDRLVVEVLERDFYDTAMGDTMEVPYRVVEEYSCRPGDVLRLIWTEDDDEWL